MLMSDVLHTQDGIAPPVERSPRLLRNRARCSRCGDTVESLHRHDFQRCGCGAVAVDGGRDYLRRAGRIEDCEELSEWENDSKETQ